MEALKAESRFFRTEKPRTRLDRHVYTTVCQRVYCNDFTVQYVYLQVVLLPTSDLENVFILYSSI